MENEGQMEFPVQKGLLALVDKEVPQDLPEQLEMLVPRAQMDQKELKGRVDPRDNLETMGKTGQEDRMAYLAYQVHLVRQDQKGKEDAQVLMVYQEKEEKLVFRETVVQMALQEKVDQLDFRAELVLKVNVDQEEIREKLVLMDLLVNKASVD